MKRTDSIGPGSRKDIKLVGEHVRIKCAIYARSKDGDVKIVCSQGMYEQLFKGKSIYFRPFMAVDHDTDGDAWVLCKKFVYIGFTREQVVDKLVDYFVSLDVVSVPEVKARSAKEWKQQQIQKINKERHDAVSK